MICQSDVTHALRAAGIRPGDAIFVHSALRALGDFQGPRAGAGRAALHDAIGPRGTLGMPAFNFDFCHGAAYDHRLTPSTAGALTEAFRLEPGTVRTLHPVHSICLQGPLARDIARFSGKSSFGGDTAFGNMLAADFKLAMLGTPWNTWSFYHVAEELAAVPYRFWKLFSGWLRVDGANYFDTYPMWVRRDMGLANDFYPMSRRLIARGFVQTVKLGAAELHVVRARDLVHETLAALAADPYILCAKPAP